MIVGKTVGDKYQILEQIRQQRFYDVYIARLKDSEQRVILKWIKKELVESGETFKRLRANLSMVASLRHQHVASLRDFGEDESIYLVEDFFDCASLRDVMDRAGGINALQALNLGIKIVDSLSAAHTKGIVHGHLTPESVEVSGDLNPRVSDFYFLYALTSELKTSTEFQGRDIRYCSPEIIAGAKPTYESDIYSIGVILYELITGKPPFEEQDSLLLALEKVQVDVKSPRELNPEVPRLLESVILKCIKRKPESRYKNARELLSELYLCRSSIIRAASEAERKGELPQKEQQTPSEAGKTTTLNALVSRNEGIPEAAEKQQPSAPDSGQSPGGGKNGAASGTPAGGDSASSTGIPEKRFRLPKGAVPFFISFGVLVMLVVFLIEAFLHLPQLGGGVSFRTVIVPSVVGKSVVEAKSLLGNDGLAPKVVDRQTSAEIPKGYIILQRPEGGTKVKSGREIQLIVSTGRQKGVVPELTGLSLQDAIKLIEKSDFKPGEQREEYNDKFKEGIVIEQSPAPGEERDAGYPVSLIVSKGVEPDLITVPRVTDMPVDEAKNILEMNELANVEVSTMETTGATNDYIAAQSVLEGTRVPPDRKIVLYSAKAPKSSSLEEVKGVVNIEISEKEKQEVVVMVYDQDRSREVYRGSHVAGDNLKVPVSGFGKVYVLVYMNGNLFKEQEL